MNDAPDPLERELAALRPSAVSPELRQREIDGLQQLRADAIQLRPQLLIQVPHALGTAALLAPGRDEMFLHVARDADLERE